MYASLDLPGASLMEPARSVWTDPANLGNTPANLRLYCFPFAGAGSTIFRPWWNEIARGIQVCGIQLPGRGVRFTEPRYTRVQPLIRSLADDLSPLPDLPFALFGHSLGALLAFEFARELRRRGRQPIHLIVSGLPAPQMSPATPHISSLPPEQFLAALTALNGIPEQLLAEPEFLRIMLPVLRDDFEMLETYCYTPEPPLDCRISAYAGRNDQRSSAAGLIFWKAQTTGPFSCRIFPGDHFFLETARRAFLSALSVDLIGAYMTCQAQNHNQNPERQI